MAVININFHNPDGKMFHTYLSSDFTMDDFANLVRDKFGGLSHYRFTINSKQLAESNGTVLDNRKHLITDNCTILVSNKMEDGCFLPDTLIMRPDRTQVSINIVQPGDELLAFTSKGEIVVTIVEQVFVRNVDDYVELQVGEDKIVSVTPDHWIYAGNESFVQLRNLCINDSLFSLSNVGNDLSVKPITALKPIEAPSTCVYNLHTAEPHTYFANGIAVHNMSGNLGTAFVDVSNESGLQHIKFSQTGPRWRIAEGGLCLEGKCLNASCVAYQQQVIINIGYKQFDVLTDANAQTSKCPVCLKYVEPATCGFTQCLWRWWGIKKPGSGLPPVELPPCHWKEVVDDYVRFDEQRSGSVIWLKLILEASSMDRCRG
jgi:hypothetical protein